MQQQKIGIIIPTLHGPETLDSVLESIFQQSRLPDRVVVVEQTLNGELAHLQEKWKSKVEFIHSDIGVSRARNMGLCILRDMDMVGFLDDDTLLGKDYLAIVEQDLRSNHAVSGLVKQAGKGRLPYSKNHLQLNRFSIWRNAIEAGTFVTRTFLCFSGKFDENLGLGSKTSAKSGEGTDFLLKGMSCGLKLAFDPRLEVTEMANIISKEDLRRKKYDYAIGTGVVIYRFYKRIYWPYFLLGPLKNIRDRDSMADACLVILGRVRGIALASKDFKNLRNQS